MDKWIITKQKWQVRVPDLTNDKLCWKQCIDERAPMVRCTLIKNHEGKHSWEK